MIVDIPGEVDFRASGLSFLNLAWEAAWSLVDVDSDDEDDEISDEYWSRAQGPLGTALALAQQGTEFLLKARVAAVSPYLLISGSPRDWPRGSDKTDTPYSDFHSFDAADLVRAHDTVVSTKLSPAFRARFEEMRRARNRAFHSVDKKRRFTAKEVVLGVLEANHELGGGRSWVSERKSYLDEASPIALQHNEEAAVYVAYELRAAIDALTRSECDRLLGVQKRQRFYACPECVSKYSSLVEHVRTAQLRPNRPGGKSVFCYACEASRPVRRARCPGGECRGNVIDAQTGSCLSCGV